MNVATMILGEENVNSLIEKIGSQNSTMISTSGPVLVAAVLFILFLIFAIPVIKRSKKIREKATK
jgi:flagellar biosynthesis/type III secretory pathway M-ring protein FliF/YscJ